MTIPPRGTRPESGSAYLLAITVLLALTGLGLAVSKVGQLERRLGSVDADRRQALQAAHSGLAVAVARLLDGQPPIAMELAFGPTASTGAIRLSRARISAPTLVETAPCRACADADGRWARVSFALSVTGERELRWAPVGVEGMRILARVAVESLVTLQPWPTIASEAASEAASEDPQSSPGGCLPGPYRRAYLALARELHPPGCRLAAVSFQVPAADPSSGATCLVRMPVCVWMSDWRELG